MINVSGLWTRQQISEISLLEPYVLDSLKKLDVIVPVKKTPLRFDINNLLLASICQAYKEYFKEVRLSKNCINFLKKINNDDLTQYKVIFFGMAGNDTLVTAAEVVDYEKMLFCEFNKTDIIVGNEDGCKLTLQGTQLLTFRGGEPVSTSVKTNYEIEVKPVYIMSLQRLKQQIQTRISNLNINYQIPA